jgi:hypothetical protein
MNGGSIMLTMQETSTPIFYTSHPGKAVLGNKAHPANFRTVALDEMQAYTCRTVWITKYLIRLGRSARPSRKI